MPGCPRRRILLDEMAQKGRSDGQKTLAYTRDAGGIGTAKDTVSKKPMEVDVHGLSRAM